MAKRALLVASQTAGLQGCESDVALLGDVLGGWGFTCTALSGAGATRDGILDAYRGLIDETSSEDSVVVYYSGHGGRIRNVASINEQTDAYWQFIVPTDFERSGPDDFRGIFADELRALQLELTTKTGNVTTILDCCHSALMSRDPALVARFLSRPWNELRPGATARAQVAADRVRAVLGSAGPERADAESNQRAVRLVACLPTESAFEMASPELGAVHGLLTEAVAGLLREAQPRDGGSPVPVTWDDLARRARALVLARAPSQHVVAEGPAQRLLFSSSEHDASRGWPVELVDGAAVLPAAALLGIGPGDVVSLSPGSADAAGPLVATVERIEAGRALLALADGAGVDRLDAATEAWVTTARSGRRPVIVEPAAGPGRDAVTSAIDGSPRVQAVEAAAEPLARVVLADDGMLLVGPEGMPYYASPRPVDDTQLRRLTADLEQLAKVAVVRELTSGSGDEALEVPVAFTVHATADGPPLEPGVSLPVGPAFFRVHHLGSPNDPPVFVNVVDIGQTGDVAVLSAGASPTGLQLTPKQSYTLYGEQGGWLSWPPGLPADEPRPETLVAVFTDGELDVRALEASGVAARGDGHAAGGSLGTVLAEASSGVRRSAGPRPSAGTAPMRYRVERFEFLLDPGFQVDESRDVSGTARGGGSADVAVRLLELVVRRNRSLFSTDARLDAVFVTRAADGGGSEVSTQTWAFPGVGDGDALSIGELGLFVGTARDFLEMAIWVSRANQQQPNLAELAGSVLKRLPVTAAAGQVVEMVGRALRRVVNRSIGLYRTTLLVPEGLTAGRRPASGLVEAQDMAFAYDVVVRDDAGRN